MPTDVIPVAQADTIVTIRVPGPVHQVPGPVLPVMGQKAFA